MIAFLGSLSFALFLIAATALFAVAGTFLESVTGSHFFASQLTYESPFFKWLLLGYFVNILLSALKRWPFKKKHIPFLVTHLALLLLIFGIFIKHTFGLQGTMMLTEGGSASSITLPGTYALHVETKRPLQTKSERQEIPLKQSLFSKTFQPLLLPSGLKGEVSAFFPHSEQKIHSWIHGKKAHFFVDEQEKTFSVHLLQKETPLPDPHPLILPGFETTWNFYAIETDDGESMLQRLFENLTEIRLYHKQELLFKGSVQEALEQNLVSFQGKTLTQGSKHPLPATHYLLKAHPTLAMIKNAYGDLDLWTLSERGEITIDSFSSEKIPSLYLYDEGFSGMFVPWTFPLSTLTKSPEMLKHAFLHAWVLSLHTSVLQQKPLSPPLEAFKDACAAIKKDFTKESLQFFHKWLDESASSSPSIHQIVEHMSLKNPQELYNFFTSYGLNPKSLLKTLPKEEKKAIVNSYLTASRFLQKAKEAFYPFDLLPSETLLPVFNKLPEDSLIKEKVLNAFYTFKKENPEFPFDTLEEALQYGIPLLPFPKDPKSLFSLVFESPLEIEQVPLPPLRHQEKNIPLIHLKVFTEGFTKDVALRYDASGEQLSVPLLLGHSKLTFGPCHEPLPYEVKLQEARQINYPGSSQAFSYESSLWIKDLRDHSERAFTLSMNEVYETKEGYRFYLSNLTSQDNAPKKVLLVVNYDPVRYLITYPAAALLSLGILLLLTKKLLNF